MKYLLSALFLSVVSLISAENLKVLDINHGTVRVNGKQLQKGSQFNSKAKIVWSDNKQIIKVINIESHKINIYAAQIFKVAQMSSIDELLFQKQRLSSRDGILMNVHDFANFFNCDIALMQSFSMETGYTFDDSHFLFLQYDYLGEKINKRLQCEMHTVLFNDSIFYVDGKPIEKTVLTTKLFYYDVINEQITLLADNFTIHITPRWTCQSFLDTILDNNLSIAELSELAYDYCRITFPDIKFLPVDMTAYLQNCASTQKLFNSHKKQKE